MLASRWAVSLFFVCHITAIFLGALPPPEALPKVEPPRQSDRDILAAHLTPWLDASAASFLVVPVVLWKVTAPLRRLSDFYLSITGLGQRWNMFSNPPTYDEYLRVRYYIGASKPTWVATELVLPAGREDQVRLVQAYRDSFRDKAMAIALYDFYRHRAPRLIRPDTKSSELPDDLAPIGRYFSRQFQRAHLAPHERILRIEIWHGKAELAVPHSSPEFSARLALLRQYYAGPIEQRSVPPRPPYHGVERAGTIEWTLEYFEP